MKTALMAKGLSSVAVLFCISTANASLLIPDTGIDADHNGIDDNWQLASVSPSGGAPGTIALPNAYLTTDAELSRLIIIGFIRTRSPSGSLTPPRYTLGEIASGLSNMCSVSQPVILKQIS